MRKFMSTFLLCTVSIVLILAGWLYMTTAEVKQIQSPEIDSGLLDLTGIPLDEAIVNLPSQWEFYPNQLYTPKDLTSKNTISPKIRDQVENASAIPYGTYRLKIKLSPNGVFSMCGYSIDYSTRVYVNGALASEAGKVSDDPKKSVPRINYCTIPVVADSSGIVEVVVQYSNFVHREGGSIGQFTLSTPANIESYKTIDTLSAYLTSGGLLLLFAYYLLKFAISKKRDAMFFALCCLIFALRNQRFYVIELMPWDYNWYLQYRMIVIFIVVQPWIIYMLFDSLYPEKRKKVINWTYTVLTAIIVAAIFLKSTMYTAPISNYAYYIAVPYFAYLAFRIIRPFVKGKRFDKKDILTFSGIGVLILTMLIEVKWQRILPEITRKGATPLGMLIFVFLMMIVIELRYGEHTVQLIEAKKEKKILEQQAQMRSDFLSNISHEMLTPLTIMSGYAQRAIIDIENNQGGKETCQGLLHISLEAQRLSMLVEQILENPLETSGNIKIGKIDLVDISMRVQSLCNPVLKKNNNSIKIDINPECHYVTGNLEMILQVILNLCVNANRHTKDDCLTLNVHRQDGVVRFTFDDHGDGMEESVVNNAFERGYSGDGKTGLGLSICRDIITYLGGEINIYSAVGKGTQIVFGLNEWEEDEDGNVTVN